MKIIEIRTTQCGEVAYVFDEESGKIMKVLVEDWTRGEVEEEDAPPLRRLPRRKVRPVPMPTRGEDDVLTVDDIPDDLPDIPEQKQRKIPGPKVSPKSIMPPHMRGIFLKPDEPGAAVERRQV